MTYHSKLEKAHAELAQTDILESNYKPPLFIMLRKFGVKIRPMHYNHFFANFAFTATFFGLIWGVLMWFTTWSTERLLVLDLITTSIIFGVLFGFIMALYYKKSTAKNNLTHWDDL